jgi:hypothetical protein
VTPFVRSVARQAAVSLAAALVVAWVLGQSPALRAWLKSQTKD